ncbi:hypothetical protein HPB48_011081 [Haemaphysalis longicornis]|uniref:Uncharacterized protein n=1 Tax=Haemaphysalis longicornis TaxID=44386 RepID=A0A9J6GS26_HAELO|nr:hypothetical protein HPB48_011081 [Haemaphysalis longicornis]
MCTTPFRCPNCALLHDAFYRRCPAFQKAKQVATLANTGCSRKQALQTVNTKETIHPPRRRPSVTRDDNILQKPPTNRRSTRKDWEINLDEFPPIPPHPTTGALEANTSPEVNRQSSLEGRAPLMSEANTPAEENEQGTLEGLTPQSRRNEKHGDSHNRGRTITPPPQTVKLYRISRAPGKPLRVDSTHSNTKGHYERDLCSHTKGESDPQHHQRYDEVHSGPARG